MYFPQKINVVQNIPVHWLLTLWQQLNAWTNLLELQYSQTRRNVSRFKKGDRWVEVLNFCWNEPSNFLTASIQKCHETYYIRRMGHTWPFLDATITAKIFALLCVPKADFACELGWGLTHSFATVNVDPGPVDHCMPWETWSWSPQPSDSDNGGHFNFKWLRHAIGPSATGPVGAAFLPRHFHDCHFDWD